MSGPDRTDELVRAMLERRSGGTPPVWLLDATMDEVVRSRRSGLRGRSLVPADNAVRMAILVAALAILALATAITAGAFLDRDDNPLDPRVAVVDASPTRVPTSSNPPSETAPASDPEQPSTVPETDAPATNAPPTTKPRTTAEPGNEPGYPNGIDVESPIGVDAVARVTQAGDGLRVRTKPGLGEDSERLTPLLRSGAVVFVTDGPVTAAGYDWYQVMADTTNDRLFGWVAAGPDDEPWLISNALDCDDDFTEAVVTELSAYEIVHCYGNATVTVTAPINDGLGPVSEGITEEDIACPDLVAADGCELGNPWLQIPRGSFLVPVDGGEAGIQVALPPGIEDRYAAAPLNRDVQFLIGMDAEESQDCAVIDNRTGENHVSRDEAITSCRLTFVLRDISW